MAVLTSTAVRCIGFGRRISTDIALPGALVDRDPRAAQIVIRRNASPIVNCQTRPTLLRDGATLCFTPPGVAEYRCAATDPATIDVIPHAHVAEDELAALLIATALPGLLWLQGAFMLHATAVQMPGRDHAIAIAAPSGIGKSTMLAALAAHGARVLADDTVCLHIGDRGSIKASGLPGGYFVREADDDDLDRRFVTIDRTRAVAQAELRAILFLKRHPEEISARFSRLTALQGLAALLSHRHRAAIPAMFGETGRCLADAAQIARLPAYAWHRRTGSIPLTSDEWATIDRLSGGLDDD